jgi:hypothetical protein
METKETIIIQSFVLYTLFICFCVSVHLLFLMNSFCEWSKLYSHPDCLHSYGFVHFNSLPLPLLICCSSFVSVCALIIRHYRTVALKAATIQMLPKPDGKFHNAPAKKNLCFHVRFADILDDPVISVDCSLDPN